MSHANYKSEEVRDLPKDIEYYTISGDGVLEESLFPIADVYISEFDVRRCIDPATLLSIKKAHGCHVGVMHDISCDTDPEEFHTTKMLIGVARR